MKRKRYNSEINTNAFRKYVADLITSCVSYRCRVTVAIVNCAARRKRTFRSVGMFKLDDHQQFSELLSDIIAKHANPWIPLLTVTYYKSLLIDKILITDDWILDSLEDLHACEHELAELNKCSNDDMAIQRSA